MRLVCEFSAALPAGLTAGTRIGFDDASHPGRIGWHEVVVTGSGVTLALGGLPAKSVSNRLRLYPANLIPHPLAVNNVTFAASPGGAATPYVEPADALPLVAPASPEPSTPPTAASPAPSSSPGAAGVGGASLGGPAGPAPGGTGAVPGGVVGLDIAGLIGASAITPFVLLASLMAAGLLGAGHALTPGHGKTLMGAYLVGSRGSAIHAIALGLSVTVSHTLGIIILAALILQARDVAPELFNTIAPVASGLPWWPSVPGCCSARRGRGGRRRAGSVPGMTMGTSTGRTTTTGMITTLPCRRRHRSAGAACSCWGWPAA